MVVLAIFIGIFASIIPMAKVFASARDGLTTGDDWSDIKESLFLNEIMSSNDSTIRDGDVDDPDEGDKGGTYSDWIELYNSSDQAINLAGFTLSDSSSTWTIPEVFIPGKGYLIIWASDKDKVAKDGQLHTNFAISKSGEQITLKAPDGSIIDEIYVIPLSDDVTYGRAPDGEGDWYVLEYPTPGAQNSKRIATPPIFSHQGGFYTEAFDLQISSADGGGAKIYYTLDGSEPVPGADGTMEYSGSIPIKSRKGDPNIVSNIRTSMSWRAPNGEVFKGTVVRAKVVGEEGQESDIVTHTYFVDPDMYKRYDLPIISIVTDSKNLFDDTIGIYTIRNADQRGGEWERPIHIEFFEDDGSLGFSQNAGVRIHGGATRSNPQKSLRLYAKSDYDVKDYFDYDIFSNLTNKVDGEKITRFKRLLLRTSGNDWTSTLFRDAMAQSLISHLKLDTQAYRPSLVFINGEYWGIHNIRERYDRFYVATNYNLDRDAVAILEAGYDFFGENYEVSEGTQEDADAYMNEVTGFLRSNPVTLQENYEYIKTKIDIENFIDYQIVNIYFSNTDWPGNNVKLWKYKTKDGQYDPDAPYGQDGRWRWMVYDTDFGFGFDNNITRGRVDHDTLEFATATNGPFWPNPPASTFLLRTLLENSEFRNKFINHFADHLNTAFQPELVNQRIDEMKSKLESSIQEHINRWPGSINNWDNNVQVMKDFANDRPGYVMQHIMKKFSNVINGTASVKLNTNLNEGHIKINSIDINSATPGVADPESWTGTYFKGVPITIKAVPKVGYKFDHWEGIDGVDVTSDTISIPLSSDLNITAHFVQSDTVPPVITLKGIPGIGVRLGDTYIDEGATATDDVDGDITSRIVVEGNVDTNTPGTYTLVYKVSDLAGNEAEEVTRTVVVADLSPEPYNLSQGPYSFTEWSADSPEGTYPQNMIFLQTDLSDTRLEDEMTAPYCNVDALAYNNTRRTRINGLGEDGVAFINTGRDKDLGAAVLALDTTGMKNVKVSWTAGTLLPNSRSYAFILQYRVGKSGEFKNVESNGEIVEYYRSEEPGHTQTFTDILLPEEVSNQPHVELRWKYYLKGNETSGPRSQLRLDDIFVTAEPEGEEEENYTVITNFNMDELSPDGTLTAEVNVTNNKGTHPSVMAIVALYDSKDRMVNISYIAKKIDIGNTEKLYAGFRLPENIEGYRVSVFVWDGTDLKDSKMIPLSNVVSIY